MFAVCEHICFGMMGVGGSCVFAGCRLGGGVACGFRDLGGGRELGADFGGLAFVGSADKLVFTWVCNR